MADWEQTEFQISDGYIKETLDFIWTVLLTEGGKIEDGITLEPAAGGGGVTKPLLDNARYNPQAHIATDMSRPNLIENHHNLESHLPKFVEKRESQNFLENIAEEEISGNYVAHVDAGKLWTPPGSVKRVIIGNAFHMFPNKHDFISEVNESLEDGGYFAFNSGYLKDAVLPGTTDFYDSLYGRVSRHVMRDRNAPFDIKETMRNVKQDGVLKEQYRGTEDLTLNEYDDIFRNATNGEMRIESHDRHIVSLGHDFWKGFIKDPDFVRGYLLQWGVITNEIAPENVNQEWMDYVQGVLDQHLDDVFKTYSEKHNVNHVDRLWYDIIARKGEIEK